MALSAGQRRAVELASDAPLLVLTGGPGCGKTATVRTVIKLWAAQGKLVRIAAPTGAAWCVRAGVCAPWSGGQRSARGWIRQALSRQAAMGGGQRCPAGRQGWWGGQLGHRVAVPAQL